jgi:hypothetical protein
MNSTTCFSSGNNADAEDGNGILLVSFAERQKLQAISPQKMPVNAAFFITAAIERAIISAIMPVKLLTTGIFSDTIIS